MIIQRATQLFIFNKIHRTLESNTCHCLIAKHLGSTWAEQPDLKYYHFIS